MKLTKIALAAAIVAGSTNVSAAKPQHGNKVSIDTDVLVYVAAGLSVEVTQQLKFSDIVIPATGSGASSGMSMNCKTGDVSYANAGSNPNGPDAADGGANANGNKQAAQVGQVEIQGEGDYAISVSAAVGNDVPDGVTFTPWLGWNNNASGSIQRSLGTNGKKTVAFCGSVSVDETVATSEELKVPVVITISYR